MIDMKTKPVTAECSQCSEKFESRNKLFRHLKECNGNDTNASTCAGKTMTVKRRRKNDSVDDDDERDSEYNKAFDAYIYVTGGRNRGKTLCQVERYSMRRRVWEQCPSMLESRGSHGSSVVSRTGGADPQLYVIGGGGTQSNLSTNERLNLTSNCWENIAPMPSCRHALVVISHLHYIFAVGGWIDGSRCSSDLEKYDAKTNTWSTCSNMPTARRLCGACVLHNKIYVFGGNIDYVGHYSNKLEVYDIDTDTWSTGANLPVEGQCSACVVNERIFVFIHGRSLYEYKPNTNTYEVLCAELPLKNWFCFDVVGLNDCIYLTGGMEDGKWLRVFFRLDLDKNEWVELEPMKKVRRRVSTAAMEIELS